MENVLIYVIQVNILIAISYLGYHMLLKNLTFYKLNRIYLLSAVLFSMIYPFLDIKSLFQQHLTAIGKTVTLLPTDLLLKQSPTPLFTLATALLVTLAIGASIFIVKLLFQLASLLRIHWHSRPAIWQTYLFRNVLFPIVPFSFMKKIYLNKEQHQDIELSDIFKHEYIHVKGLHTIDILLFELVLICCWYNPLVWLMRKAVRENLEFLTDQQVLNRGVERKTYQYSLLHVNKQGMALGISNQFNFKTLKKRMMMMNKKRSSRLELSKYAFLLPVFIFAAAAFTVDQAEAKIVEVAKVAQETDLNVISSELKLNQLLEKEDTTITSKIVTIKGNDIEKVEPENFTDASLRSKLSFENLSLEKRPLVYIDGTQSSSADIEVLSAEMISDFTIFKDEASKSLYGEKGKNGVIAITTKKNASAITSDLKGKVIGVTSISSPNRNGLDTVKFAQKNVLYVIDGQVIPHSEINNLDPNSIESFSVLKDAGATAIYGEKGKNGAILITTKDNTAQSLPRQIEKYNIDDVFIVDGKDVSFNEFTSLDPSTIESKTVKSEGGIAHGDKVKKTVTISTNNRENLSSAQIEKVNIVGYSKDPTSSKVEIHPEPKNGMAEFRKWIGMNFVYPKAALDAGVKGVVQASFIVEEDGSLSDLKIIQDIGYGTGEAAINLLTKSPKWTPGSRDGKPMRVQFTMPIHLDLGK